MTAQPPPLFEDVVHDLRVLRERGLLRLRQLALPALYQAVRAAGAADDVDASAVEQHLRAAVVALGDEETGTAAAYLFGLVQGTIGRRPTDLRERAAQEYGLSAETFRKDAERLIIARVADEILRLARAGSHHGLGSAPPRPDLSAEHGSPGAERANGVIYEPPMPPERPSAGVPRVWNVQSRRPHFVGRVTDLEALSAGFDSGSPTPPDSAALVNTVRIQAVHGMGGVGKTQLAAEFAYTRSADYDVVWWVQTEEPALVPGQLADLATRLGAEPRSGDSPTIRHAVHQGLSRVGNWLLIFDNADSTDVVSEWVPTSPLASDARGHVIVTTRRQGFDVAGPVRELGVLGLDDAVDLLRRRVPVLEQGDAHEIAQELDRLPLALEQAAAFLNMSRMPASRYVQLLRTRQRHYLGRGGRVSDHTIATLWELSLRELSSRHPAAVQLLGICAFLAPVAIPEELFSRHPSRLPEPLSAACTDAEVTFEEVVASLVDYALTSRTRDGLVFHRLVQAAVRARADDNGTPPSATPSRNVGGKDVRQRPEPDSLTVALSLLAADVPGEIQGRPEGWQRWSVLLPHVLTVTSPGAVDDAQLDRPARANLAWLLDRAGAYLQTRGRYREAAALIRRALDIGEEAWDQNDLDLVRCLDNLALVLRELGEPRMARPHAERALALTESVLGAEHSDVGMRASNLVLVLREMGETAFAQPLAERALSVVERQPSPDPMAVATCLRNLAWVLRDLGEATRARSLAQRALDLTEATLGSEHPDVAVQLSMLAGIVRDLGDTSQALAYAARALRISELALGPEHPDVATCLTNLALLRQAHGDALGARPMAERALFISERALGPNHPHVAIGLSNLALILQDLGDLSAARPLAERALAITENARGPEHPDLTVRAHMLGALVQRAEEAGRRPDQRLSGERLGDEHT